MQPPGVRLTAKIANTVALIASRPPSHPLYHFYQHARKTRPQAHRSPLHRYFQSQTADLFKNFADIQQPDPSSPLPPTPNFSTLIIQDKDKAVRATEVLKPSTSQIIVYSDGSCIEGKNTAAAAWCANNQHFSSCQLGSETEFGIFEAEYVGLIQALRLAKHFIQPSTRQITLILDNQGGRKGHVSQEDILMCTIPQNSSDPTNQRHRTNRTSTQNSTSVVSQARRHRG